MEGMLHQCFRLPDEGEAGEWVATNDVVNALHEKFPEMRICHATKVRIGQVLRYLGCQSKRNQKGMLYQLKPITAA